jgi:segregation and condensation protein A
MTRDSDADRREASDGASWRHDDEDRRAQSDGSTCPPIVPRFERADVDAVSGGIAGEDGSSQAGDEVEDGRVAGEDGASQDGDGAGDGSVAGDDSIPLDIAGHDDRDPPDPGSDGAEATVPTADDPSPEGLGPPGSDDEEVEPVEVLVGLAEEGEIDPWDIEVVRVTDKFLAAMDEADLRTSGRALFYASVLIRMKSDAMLGPEEPDEPVEPWEAAPAEDAPIDGADPFASLEDEMERRLDRRRARGMPETLDELVRDLREAERDSLWKRSRTYETSDSPSGFRRGTQELDYRTADDLRMDDEPTEREVTGATHAEDVDRIIEDVYEVLSEQYENDREEVLYREIATAGGSRVETYLGLLFLAHRGRVRLSQDQLFGDLWIRDPGAGGSEEALAD